MDKTNSHAELPPGVAGLLIDEIPMLTTASVRPYVVATLLHRGAVRDSEIIASLVPHCSPSDLKVGEWDPLDEEWCEGTRLEKIVNEVLGEFVSEELIRYNDELDLWVLTGKHIPTVISWVAALGARMPRHLLLELSRDQLNRIPGYVKFEDESI